MILLLTNDDGFCAEGLQALAQALEGWAEVHVVAPSSPQSCCSHAVTTGEELHLEQVGARRWTVSGTPSDCVRVALRWLRLRPDWILSGVNEGGNLGVDIHYSGTVAGAREARLHGIPSMALSQYLRRDLPRDWSLTAARARFVFESLRPQPLSPHQFWNVNLPMVISPEVELPITHCFPEPQMLPFEYEAVATRETREPVEGNTEERGIGDAGGNGTDVDNRKRVEIRESLERSRLIFRSNYQNRPRGDAFDVAHCFRGSITASLLDVRWLNAQVG